jgi:methionyl-tRNA synthetase
VPKPGKFTAADQAIIASADALLPRVEAAIDEFAIHRALEAIWTVIADANRYFASEEPWAHKKTDPARMATILYVTAEVTRQIAILVQAAMPKSAGMLLDQLGVPAQARDFAALRPASRLEPGTQLPPPAPVFPRHVEADSEATA